MIFNVCAVWEGCLTDEMLFSIFVWNETLNVVIALYYFFYSNSQVFIKI